VSFIRVSPGKALGYGLLAAIGRPGFLSRWESELKPLHVYLVLLSTVVALPAFAADAETGKRLAEARCAGCHIVAPTQHREVADSPPFETIGRKFGFNPEQIAAAIRAPHPRMNLTFQGSEAQDLAAYIASLAN
jgi:mono/diheme cytochrome c family protein